MVFCLIICAVAFIDVQRKDVDAGCFTKFPQSSLAILDIVARAKGPRISLRSFSHCGLHVESTLDSSYRFQSKKQISIEQIQVGPQFTKFFFNVTHSTGAKGARFCFRPVSPWPAQMSDDLIFTLFNCTSCDACHFLASRFSMSPFFELCLLKGICAFVLLQVSFCVLLEKVRCESKTPESWKNLENFKYPFLFHLSQLLDVAGAHTARSHSMTSIMTANIPDC